MKGRQKTGITTCFEFACKRRRPSRPQADCARNNFHNPMQTRYKHIIWDWNGTIVDDAWLSVEVLNSILRDFSFPEISMESYRENFSFPVVDFYRSLGFDVSREKFEEIGRTFIARFNAKRYECLLQPGALGLIAGIRGLNIPQSILSAYRTDFLEEAACHFGVLPYMSSIAGLDDIHANTKLERGLSHISSLGVEPSEILIIGDTDHDFSVARAAGTRCALVARGHQSRARLEKTGCPVFDILSSDIIARA